MPKLLIDGTSISKAPKGVGRYSFHLCDQLNRKLPEQWDIEILMFNDCHGVLNQLHRYKIHYYPKCNDFVKGLFLLPRLLKTTKADMLLRPNDCLGIRYNVPSMTVCHDINQLIRDAQEIVSGKRSNILRRGIDKLKEKLIGYSLRYSDIVFCNSKFIQSAIVEYYQVNIEKTRVAYCAVDPRFYELSKYIRDGGNLKSKLVFSKKYILTFATGDFRENFFQLPIVAKSLKDQGIKTFFVIAGVKFDHEYCRVLKRNFQESGLIEGDDFVFLKFFGEESFSEIVLLYSRADFYLDLSLHEGFGMQVIEAMACGTTCISSACGALREVCGGYAIHINPTSAGEIAIVIADAFQKNLQYRDNSDQVEFTKKYSWDNVGDITSFEIDKFMNP